MICRPKRQLAMPKRASMRTQSLCWQAAGRDVSKAKASRHKAKGQTDSGAQSESHPQGGSLLCKAAEGPTPRGERTRRQISGEMDFIETDSGPPPPGNPCTDKHNTKPATLVMLSPRAWRCRGMWCVPGSYRKADGNLPAVWRADQGSRGMRGGAG
jgi:hypothetical protein